MYQVYVAKATGEQVLAVRVKAKGKIIKADKGFIYAEYPSQVEVKAGALEVGDYVVLTEKGNVRMTAEAFEKQADPQATMIG